MNQPSEQGTTVYPLSTVEQIVSSTLFFPSTRNDWFILDLNIRNAKSVSLFKSSVKSVCDDFESMPDNEKKDLLLCGDSRFDENKNENILETTIGYIKKSGRFSGSLFEQCFVTE